MPGPTDSLKPDPLTPEYRWNEAAQRYVSASGRFVSRDTIRRELDTVLKASGKAMRQASEQLRAGNISLADWELAMMQQIKTTHLAAAAMQRGGWYQMTPADFGRVGAAVKDEYKFLRNRAAEIASGKQKLDGTLLRRAEQYGQAGRETYYRFWQSDVAKRGYDEERSILGAAEKHCAECLEEERLGWRPLGQMVPIGRRICMSGCQCRVEYRNSQTDEVLAA